MGTIERKLKSMGLDLPPSHPYPSPNRTAAVQAGNLLFLSGHGTGRTAMPLNIKQYGKVGADVSEAEAYVCAKSAALCMLASIKNTVGNLDRVKRVIRLYGMVNCAPDFDRHMVVIDGASDLFYELWKNQFTANVAELGSTVRRIYFTNCGDRCTASTRGPRWALPACRAARCWKSWANLSCIRRRKKTPASTACAPRDARRSVYEKINKIK